MSSLGDNNKMLVGEDMGKEIETPFVVTAKCRNPLPQGTCSEARRGCRHGSPPARGCFGLKPADWPVTGQAHAMQWCKFDNSLLSSNGSWTDNDSDAKGDAIEINYGDEGHAILTPVCPTTLFTDNRIPVSHQMKRDKALILNGIWPGSHNITLLTRFGVCHFAGD
jgi:hypothetical protein